MALPPLSAAQELAALRVRYPAGLICTSNLPCDHRLIAASVPNPDPDYVCFACRVGVGEAWDRARSERQRGEALTAASKRHRERGRIADPDPHPALPDRIVKPGADYTQDELRAIIEHRRRVAPESLTTRVILARVPSPADGRPYCRCRRGCCDVCQGRRKPPVKAAPIWAVLGVPVGKDGFPLNSPGSRNTGMESISSMPPIRKPASTGTSRDSSAPLAAAQKRLGKPGRKATGTSRWARRRARQAAVEVQP